MAIWLTAAVQARLTEVQVRVPLAPLLALFLVLVEWVAPARKRILLLTMGVVTEMVTGPAEVTVKA